MLYPNIDEDEHERQLRINEVQLREASHFLLSQEMTALKMVDKIAKEYGVEPLFNISSLEEVLNIMEQITLECFQDTAAKIKEIIEKLEQKRNNSRRNKK